jgi:soluble lytic murein transglycosylase
MTAPRAALALLGLWLAPGLASARPAGSAQLLRLDVRRLGQAQAALDAGRPTVALRTLGDDDPAGLEDRARLIRGLSALAVGEWDTARSALREAERSALVPSVRRHARIALLDTYRQAPDHSARLALLERIDSSRASHLYQRAESLIALGRKDEARALLRRIAIERPASTLDDDAQRRLKQLGAPALTPAERRRRVDGWLAAGDATAAAREAAQLKLGARERRLLDWRIAQARGQRSAAQSILLELYADQPGGADGDEVLWTLGKQALNADDNAQAQARFDELVRRFPASSHAAEAAYLAAWIPYDDGDFAAANRRMLAYADQRPRDPKVTEALWYAGWSAYLAGDDARALAAFERLRTEHPSSDLIPFAWYWTGKIHERRDATEPALDAYRRTSESGPLTYYGFLARNRLRRLGQPIPAPSPTDRLHHFGLGQIISSLGPARPIQVDRAIAFHEKGMERWVQEELRSALRELERPRSIREQVLRADLCRLLDAPRASFLLSRRAGLPPQRLFEGDNWAWRVYQHRFPAAYRGSVEPAAREHGVSPFLVWSIMRTESHYQSDAKSPVGALGLMQLLPRTAAAIATRDPRARPHRHRLLEPGSNAWLGTWYLARLSERFPGYLPAQIAAYNAGPSAAQRWLEEHGGRPTEEFVERISYRETRRYVRRVLETLWAYQTLYQAPLTQLPTTATVGVASAEAVRF